MRGQPGGVGSLFLLGGEGVLLCVLWFRAHTDLGRAPPK